MLVYTRTFEIIVFLAFWALLGAAIFMMISFYVCDNQTCKPFVTAEQAGPTGSKEYTLSVLNEFGRDGIWPPAYIGAAILTPLCLWFLRIPITILTFGVLFFISFVIIYFMFSFYNHHYLRFINENTTNFIQNNCPGIATDTNANTNVPPDDPDAGLPSIGDIPPIGNNIGDDLGITFATPINIF